MNFGAGVTFWTLWDAFQHVHWVPGNQADGCRDQTSRWFHTLIAADTFGLCLPSSDALSHFLTSHLHVVCLQQLLLAERWPRVVHVTHVFNTQEGADRRRNNGPRGSGRQPEGQDANRRVRTPTWGSGRQPEGQDANPRVRTPTRGSGQPKGGSGRQPEGQDTKQRAFWMVHVQWKH